MKNRTLRLFIAGLAYIAVLSGCGSSSGNSAKEQNTSDTPSQAETNSGDATQADNTDIFEYDSLYSQNTFIPGAFNFALKETESYPYMGLDLTFPNALIDSPTDRNIFTNVTEAFSYPDGAISFSYLFWSSMTDEQKTQEISSDLNSYYDWVDSLTRIGTLGIYENSQVENLDELTGCSQHEKLGESTDGNYQYYLSWNPDADADIVDLLKQIEAEITDLTPSDGHSAFDQPSDCYNVDSVGNFTTQDIYGNTVTQDIFADYDLTLVNIYTTWCSPCVQEIPELEQLHQELSDQGVNVVGVVLDAVDNAGNPLQDVVETAVQLAERTGATYPFLLPDETFMNGRLSGISAFPETFFVDRNGNIVGEPYVGSRSFDDWLEITLQELDALKGIQ